MCVGKSKCIDPIGQLSRLLFMLNFQSKITIRLLIAMLINLSHVNLPLLVYSNVCKPPNQCLNASQVFLGRNNATKFLKALDGMCSAYSVVSGNLQEECCNESDCCNREELSEHGIHKSPQEVSALRMRQRVRFSLLVANFLLDIRDFDSERDKGVREFTGIVGHGNRMLCGGDDG